MMGGWVLERTCMFRLARRMTLKMYLHTMSGVGLYEKQVVLVCAAKRPRTVISTLSRLVVGKQRTMSIAGPSGRGMVGVGSSNLPSPTPPYNQMRTSDNLG